LEQTTELADQTDQALVLPSLPTDLPSPELFETTLAIFATIEQTPVPEPQEKTREAYKRLDYTLVVPAADSNSIDMVAIPGGDFDMGSPDTEPHRQSDEGPVHPVHVDSFWISTIEVPWELYTAFMENGRPRSKGGVLIEKRASDELWDAVTQPTAPYIPMNFGMGNGYEKGMPAISMSHYAASKFCEWLSAQTGQYFRLPTEAEWEYACRSGSSSPYCFGKSEKDLGRYAWFWNNADDRYQRVATRQANAWGIFDMHGNVAEWVLDTYAPYEHSSKPVKNPLVLVDGANGHVVRGGSWDDDPDSLRSAARRKSSVDWNRLDPQNPKSVWYLTNGATIGFRIVRPMKTPDIMTIHRLWNASKGQP
jgi:formylglycine-generating enzyme required for sulfatase activity